MSVICLLNKLMLFLLEMKASDYLLSAFAVVDGRIVIDSDAAFSGDSVELPANTEMRICNGATVTCRNLSFGKSSRLLIESGSLTVNSGCRLTMKDGSVLDVCGGRLVLTGAECRLYPESTLILSDKPVVGGKLIGGWGVYSDIESNRRENFHSLRSYIQAPVNKVFDGTEFDGRWDMDRAYPQWFAGADCDDWSEPINKAIKLKKSGEVFLPAGVYKVKYTIRVLGGIQLVGEPGVYGSKDEKNRPSATVIVPVPISVKEMSVDAPENGRPYVVHGFSMGCVVAVNITQKYLDMTDFTSSRYYKRVYAPGEECDIQDNTIAAFTSFANAKRSETPPVPEFESGMWEIPSICPGTMVKNITISNSYFYNKLVQGGGNRGDISSIPFLCGTYIAGAATITYNYFDALWQSIVWSDEYADCKTVTRNTITVNSRIDFKVSESGTPLGDIIEDYIINFGFLGDALIFQGNGLHGPFRSKGVKIFHSYGAVVDGNILNLKTEFQSCNAATFSNNHLEGADAQLLINCSNVFVSSNYFEKGKKPSILFISNTNARPLVTLENNVFQWFGRYVLPSSPSDFGDYITRLKSICDFDISFVRNNWFGIVNEKVKAQVTINNCYRVYRHGTGNQQPVAFGIKTCSQNSEDDTVYNALTQINNTSALMSINGSITPGERLSIPTYSCNDLNKLFLRPVNGATPSPSQIKEPKWLGPTGRFSYKYSIAWDVRRKIYKHNGVGGTIFDLLDDVYVIGSDYAFGQSSPANDAIDLNNIYYGEFSFYFATDDADFEECGVFCYAILYRECKNGNNGSVWHKAIVPVCGGTILYDNGLCVSGYNWQECAPPEEVDFNDGITGVEFHGNNVVAYSDKNMDFSIGQWNKGDRVFNVGSDSSWIVKIKK